MTMSLFSGLPGGGKSHEAMKEVVIPFLMSSEEKLATNLDGLQNQECLDAIDEHCGRVVSDRIMFIDDPELVRDPKYWYHPEHNTAPLIPRGSLIVLDEFPQLLNPAEKLPDHFLHFCLNHRRYTTDDGKPTNILLIAQAPSLLHRMLRKSVIATTTHFSKLSALGMNKRYLARVYSGWVSDSELGKIKSSVLLSAMRRNYDKKMFKLYKTSTNPDAHKESAVEGRGTVLSNSLIKFALPIGICLVLWGGYSTYKQFYSKTQATVPGAAAGQAQKPASAGSDSTNPAGGPVQVRSGGIKFPQTSKYVGTYSVGNERVFVFNVEGAYQYATHRDFKAVIESGPFIAFELKDGSILSETYRPAVETLKSIENAGTERGKDEKAVVGVGSK